MFEDIFPPFFQLSLSPNQSSSTHSLSFLHSSCFQLEAQFYIVSHTMYDEKSLLSLETHQF